MMTRTVLILCAGMCVWASAATVRVSDDYSTIQAALDASAAGDTVIVSPNTYTENIVFPPHSLLLTSTDPDNSAIVAATIIDGSAPDDPNFASTVTFNAAQGNDAVIAGFTITGGTGTWLPIAWRFHEVYWNRCGGGIVCCNLSQPTITKNVIRDNIAGEGGGLYVYGDPVNPGNPTNPPVHIEPVIDDNVFENNNAIKTHGYDPPDTVYTLKNHGDGGAIVCFQGVDPQITNNTIQNNHADFYGGGLHLRQWSDGLIEQNTIQGNDSALGAGVHITYTSDPTVRKNQIIANVAGGLGGGGIYVYYRSNPLIERNIITGNTSSNGAGIGTYWESVPIIQNNLIAGNLAGAGIRVTGGSIPKIRNNTITQNTGGGIQFYSSDTFPIENNLIASNGHYGIYSSQAVPVIRYNDVWNHPKGNYNSTIGDQTGLNGNISVDPNFADAGNYHILPISPCVDAGDPAAAVSPAAVDIDGERRIVNSRIDIGADEVYYSPMDFNTDGWVDLADMAEFAADWLWTGKWLD